MAGRGPKERWALPRGTAWAGLPGPASTVLLLLVFWVGCAHGSEGVPASGGMRLEYAGSLPDFYSLSGCGPGSIRAAGAYGSEAVCDGTTCTLASMGTLEHVYGLAARSPSEACAVGSNGLVMVFDGKGWRGTPAAATADLRAVWASPDGGVFAAGDRGTLLRRVGEKWTLLQTGSQADFRCMWCRSPSEIYLGGDQGRLYRYQEGRCTPNPFGFDAAIEKAMGRDRLVVVAISALWGHGAKDLFVAADEYVFHYDGTGWSSFRLPFSHGFEEESPSSSVQYARVHSLWGVSPGSVYAGGEAGEIYRFNGKDWQEVSYDRLQVWGDRPVGERRILSICGTGTGAATAGTGTGATAGEEGIFAAGQGGVILRIRHDKAEAVRRAGPAEIILAATTDRATGRAMLVGARGGLYELEGGRWKPKAEGRLPALSAAWFAGPEDVYAVSAEETASSDQALDGGEGGEGDEEGGAFPAQPGGRIYHGRKGQWTLAAQTGEGPLYAVCGHGPDSVYAAGACTLCEEGLNLLRLERAQWKRAAMPIPSGVDADAVSALWCGPDLRVFLGLSDGTVLRYAQGVYARIGSFPGFRVEALWGSALDRIFAVGADAGGGRIVRYDGGRWTPVPLSGPCPQFNSLDGDSRGRIVAVGDKGTVLYHDGQNWRRPGPFVSVDLVLVRHLSGGRFVVGGRDGSIFHCMVSD